MNIYFLTFISVSWWAQVDSNHRPRAYQARALTTWAMSPWSFSVYLVLSLHPCFYRASSRGTCSHSLCRSLAVRLSGLVEMMGIEPMTPCLQGRCSPSWATPPFFLGVIEFPFGHSKLNNKLIGTRKRCFLTLSPSFSYLPTYEYDLTASLKLEIMFSIERRWSSRTFRYGYLVTT